MKLRALLSAFTKCSYCDVYGFPHDERVGLFTLRASSPLLVVVQDTFRMIFCHPVESEHAFIPTTTLVVGDFAIAEATNIFIFEE